MLPSGGVRVRSRRENRATIAVVVLIPELLVKVDFRLESDVQEGAVAIDC